MGQAEHRGRVLRVHNLRDYFRQSIDDVMAAQGVHVETHATHYVVNMMASFSRSERLYEHDRETYGIRPLALMLADAADARSGDRQRILQRIGDVALFVGGFFVDSLAGKAVDVDYYMHMGENAYGSLSEEVRSSSRARVFADVYRELATKFKILIDVLHEVRDSARTESDTDLLRTYEIWRKTGSERARRLLRQHGIVPIGDTVPARH